MIGLSYYPFWHGTLQDLEDNMHDISGRYGKELIVAEVSMGHTMEDYASYEQLGGERAERHGDKTGACREGGVSDDAPAGRVTSCRISSQGSRG